MALEEYAGIALSLVAMVTAIVVIGGILLGAILAYMRYRKYVQFTCVIWERDGFGQLSQSSDKAGIFVDSKTKNKRFFLKKNKVGLTPDNIPYLPSRSGKVKTVYLQKTGLKNFHFINVRVKDPTVTLTVGEEDVNWAINAYERAKKIFTQNLLLQYLPFIALAFVSVIILVIFIYFFKSFGDLASFATAMKEAMEFYAQAKSGTTVIPG